MVNQNPDEATHEEPVEAEPGSEDIDASGDASTGTEDSSGGTNLDPKAYKGLQRRLSAKDRELERANQRIEELTSQAQSGDLSVPEVVQLVKPVIDTIRRDDPERARAIAQQIAYTLDQRQNQSAHQELQEIKSEREREKEEQGILSDLRETAADFGVDPDDDAIDYGDSTMSIRERYALVRQTAKELSKPAKPTPTNREAVSNREGTPPSPKGKDVKYTQEDYQKALAEYHDTRKRSALEKANEIRKVLVSDLEKNLS